MDKREGKRLLVLGCGYLGKRLVGEALARGCRVKAVSRNLDTLREVETLGAEVFQGLVDENGWHGFAGKQVDWVVNCVSSAGGGLAGYRQSYIEGNRSLATWAEATAFGGRTVYTSSVSVYGNADGDWVDETNGPEPANERGRLMLESEAAFQGGMQRAKGIVLRLAGLYGPGRHLILDRLREAPKQLPGWDDYYLNLVRIEDAVSAVWESLLGTVPAGVYAIVDDEPALKREIVAWLATKLGVAIPSFTGEVGSGEAGSRRLGEAGTPANRRIRNTRFKEVCGWKPAFASFREGFGDLMERG